MREIVYAILLVSLILIVSFIAIIYISEKNITFFKPHEKTTDGSRDYIMPKEKTFEEEMMEPSAEIPDYVPRELIVKFSTDFNAEEFEQSLEYTSSGIVVSVKEKKPSVKIGDLIVMLADGNTGDENNGGDQNRENGDGRNEDQNQVVDMCFDSDGGKNIEVDGYCQVGDGPKLYDVCGTDANGNEVVYEAFCFDGNCVTEAYVCNGYNYSGCLGGMCVAMWAEEEGGEDKTEEIVDTTRKFLEKFPTEEIKPLFKIEKEVFKALPPKEQKVQKEFLSIYKFRLLNEKVDVEEAINFLEKRAGVEFVEPNYIGTLAFEPNDEFYVNEKQWAISKIQMEKAWDVWRGDTNVVVAILDTGVDFEHPDLAGKVVQGYDFLDDDEIANDTLGHGTHMAGIVAALTDNNIGIAGVCPKCKVMPVKVCNDVPFCTFDKVAAGVKFAVDNNANVINFSIVANNDSYLLNQTIDYAFDKKVFMVAPAGNNNTDRKNFPAANYKVIGVGATDRLDNKTEFSNFGNWIDVSAPGISIYSTVPMGNCRYCNSKGYSSFRGTCMSSAYVAGLAGLLISMKPYLTNVRLKQIISETVEDIDVNQHIGSGRIDAFQALMPAYYFGKNWKSHYLNSFDTNFGEVYQLTALVKSNCKEREVYLNFGNEILDCNAFFEGGKRWKKVSCSTPIIGNKADVKIYGKGYCRARVKELDLTLYES